jgi:hypothetical protein
MTRGRIQSIVRTTLAATLALAWTLIGIAQTPVIETAAELERLGPQIGHGVPDFSLADQSGATRTLKSVIGPKGAMIVFFRSADW